MKNFVKQSWLEENINRNDLIIFDTRADLKNSQLGLEVFKKSHIKGAQYVSLKEIMTGKLDTHGGRHPLPKMEDFTEDMKSFGLDDDSTVVIYDDGDLQMAGRLWWLLKYIGMDKVYILEAGFQGWIKNAGEITGKETERKEGKSLSLNIRDEFRVDMEYVRSSLYKENIAIIDARAYKRYIGEVEPLDKIPGHIPSAQNLPWMDLLDGGSIDIDNLSEKFQTLFKADEIIIYCGSGVSGTVPFILMDEIGLKPKLYAGSYSDWISYDENKVAIGETP